MSATYSSSSLDLASGSPATALCLSLSSGLKRYAFDERERIKKRRKQLNPVRLSVDQVGESDASITHITFKNQTAISSTAADGEPLSSIKQELPDDPPLDFSLDSSEINDSLPLNLTKNRDSPNSEVKIEPRQRIRSPKEDTSRVIIKSESPASDTLTSSMPEKKDISSSSFSSIPSSSNVMRNLLTNSLVRSSCRIFNPEAFCNICNKEFCNKYFLKTHKANKHGVYCETKESYNGDIELSAAMPLMFSWNVKSNNNIKAATSNPYLFNTTIKDSSAFCNICEKEFCNKYFLRRHKEKMHGIVTFSENRKTDQSSEKSEDDDRNLEELKSSHSELNSSQLKAEREKYGKYGKYGTATSTDAVADFIKICLSSNKMLKEQEDEILKKEKRELDHISHVITGEFGVQAKEEDFTEDLETDSEQQSKQICEFCNKHLSTAAILKLHQKYVHATSPEDDKEFKHIESVYFMLLKFSWLNTTVTYCEICHTDFEKNDILEMHLMNKHGNLVDELSRIIEDAGVNGLSAPSFDVEDGSIVCQICSKTFLSNAAFQQHVYEKCSSYPEISSDCCAPSEDTDGGSKSARNFCQICKKELCNKYFMKTHMRRMHGIAIQNGVRIGGVTCEICNKELCSKYFLRVHKKNCHGITEGVSFPRISVSAHDEKTNNETVSQSCSICGRVFKSIKWLKTHLVNDHGKFGAGIWMEVMGNGNEASDNGKDTPPPPVSAVLVSTEDEKQQIPQMYQCPNCQFQTASMEVLLSHHKLHLNTTDQILYRCMYCFIVTKDKLSFDEHIAYHHMATAEFHESTEFPSRYHTANKSATSLDAKTHLYGIPNTS